MGDLQMVPWMWFDRPNVHRGNWVSHAEQRLAISVRWDHNRSEKEGGAQDAPVILNSQGDNGRWSS